MVREFKSEDEALALAQTLGLFITKKNGVFIVGNDKSEICKKYNMGFWEKDYIFYDREVFDTMGGIIYIRDKSIVDARGIELPYGIKTCQFMFDGCYKLKYPSAIPVGVVNCESMFDGCKRLKYSPKIPEGVKNCYGMLKDCGSLKYPPTIPEGILYCNKMFLGCLSLKRKPVFPPNADTTKALDSVAYVVTRKIITITLRTLLLAAVVGIISLFFYLPFTDWVAVVLCSLGCFTCAVVTYLYLQLLSV